MCFLKDFLGLSNEARAGWSLLSTWTSLQPYMGHSDIRTSVIVTSHMIHWCPRPFCLFFYLFILYELKLRQEKAWKWKKWNMTSLPHSYLLPEQSFTYPPSCLVTCSRSSSFTTESTHRNRIPWRQCLRNNDVTALTRGLAGCVSVKVIQVWLIKIWVTGGCGNKAVLMRRRVEVSPSL